MTIEHRLDDLKNDITCDGLLHLFVLFEVMVELSAHRGFHDHDELLSFDESMILLHDVLVLQGFESLCFLVNLLNKVCRPKLITDICVLDRNLLSIFSVFSQHDLSESSNSKCFAQLIII